MFYPLNVTFLTRNCCWKTSFTSSSMKEFCQKMKVKLIFEASTGCQEPRLLHVWKSLT